MAEQPEPDRVPEANPPPLPVEPQQITMSAIKSAGERKLANADRDALLALDRIQNLLSGELSR